MAAAGTYQVTMKELKGAKGQKAQVYEALAQAPGTYAEIADRLATMEGFRTKQTPERIAAYYICVLKSTGHVVEVGIPEDDKIEVAGQIITGCMATIK
jgi:hypothetical protein